MVLPGQRVVNGLHRPQSEYSHQAFTFATGGIAVGRLRQHTLRRMPLSGVPSRSRMLVAVNDLARRQLEQDLQPVLLAGLLAS